MGGGAGDHGTAQPQAGGESETMREWGAEGGRRGLRGDGSGAKGNGEHSGLFWGNGSTGTKGSIGHKDGQRGAEWWLLWLRHWLEGRCGIEIARWSTVARPSQPLTTTRSALEQWHQTRWNHAPESIAPDTRDPRTPLPHVAQEHGARSRSCIDH